MKTTLFGERIPENIIEAMEYVEKVLYNAFGWKLIYKSLTNRGRHAKLEFVDKILGIRKIYLIYQREWFKKFREYFNVDDVGATINCDILERIATSYDFIVWVNKNGEVYYVSPIYMKKKVEENNWKREQEKTGEITCHIPVSMLNKIK